jgi:hypothetical protein
VEVKGRGVCAEGVKEIFLDLGESSTSTRSSLSASRSV